jgi:predicted AAA+ superfamily ATPase
MVNRTINILINHSFFLFGARGTGKTFLLDRLLDPARTLSINLLDPVESQVFALDPRELLRRLQALPATTKYVFIDEVQKVPQLLDLVHDRIEKSEFIFALSGSSARKLKRGGANLLAGRAFTYQLFPYSEAELGERFDLITALQWGTLPKIWEYSTPEERQLYLQSYVATYLKEEIAEEQIVRKLDPFRRFLQVAAQTSGQIINYTNLARDTGVAVKTVQSYFQILEDTLIGFVLQPFHESVRKRQLGNPKFYLFDEGVRRALNRTLTIGLAPSTQGFGIAFEHFIINEIIKLNHYSHKDYELSYLRTYDDAEIDLIVERPGLPRALIEIKSKEQVDERDLRHLEGLGRNVSNSEMFCFSRDPHPKRIGGVTCLPWQKGLREIGL